MTYNEFDLTLYDFVNNELLECGYFKSARHDFPRSPGLADPLTSTLHLTTVCGDYGFEIPVKECDYIDYPESIYIFLGCQDQGVAYLPLTLESVLAYLLHQALGRIIETPEAADYGRLVVNDCCPGGGWRADNNPESPAFAGQVCDVCNNPAVFDGVCRACGFQADV